MQPGAVYAVRVLGALPMLDALGRTDWKILTVRVDEADGVAAGVSDLAAAPASVRRLADDLCAWFRLRDVPSGGQPRALAGGGSWLGRAEALAVIEASHGRWRSMLARARDAAEGSMLEVAYGEAAAVATAARVVWVPPAAAATTRGGRLHSDPLHASLAAVRLGGTLAGRN